MYYKSNYVFVLPGEIYYFTLLPWELFLGWREKRISKSHIPVPIGTTTGPQARKELEVCLWDQKTLFATRKSHLSTFPEEAG
jgi:hypothetical protein